MKEKFIILLFLSLPNLFLKAQQAASLSIFSDRDVYVSGETMFVKVFSSANDNSKVCYLDLLNKQGKRVSGAILESSNHQADGYLALPDSLSSGTYLLRSYSKGSANQLKFIKEIWIANRFYGLEKTRQVDRLAQTNSGLKTTDAIIFNIQPEVKPNSDNTIIISINKNTVNQIDGDLNICISQFEPLFSSNSALLISDDKSSNELSEQNGLILSGKVTDRKNSQPVSGINVFFTIPDSIPEFQYYKTDTNGKFFFQLNNYSGTINPFIQCFSANPLQRLKITLDDSFTTSDLKTSFIVHELSDEFKNINSRNIDAITFQKIFDQQSFKIIQKPLKKTNDYPYYGKPNKIINPHLFIDLPNFTEISRELLTGVKFRNYNNEPSLQVLNFSASSYFEEMPLTLIDGIPIRDLNLIKDMGTQDIKRVEICTSERFFGDLKFSGVVAIYTTKADYSNIKENDQFIHPTLDAVQPKINLCETAIKDPSNPDLRQLLYWAPATKAQDQISVNFRTSAILGKFKIFVQGRLKDGSIISEEKQFEVK